MHSHFPPVTSRFSVSSPCAACVRCASATKRHLLKALSDWWLVLRRKHVPTDWCMHAGAFKALLDVGVAGTILGRHVHPCCGHWQTEVVDLTPRLFLHSRTLPLQVKVGPLCAGVCIATKLSWCKSASLHCGCVQSFTSCVLPQACTPPPQSAHRTAHGTHGIGPQYRTWFSSNIVRG